jgi:hypothetical protein
MPRPSPKRHGVWREISGVRIKSRLEMLAPRSFGFPPDGATDDAIRFSLRFPRFWLRQFILGLILSWSRDECGLPFDHRKSLEERKMEFATRVLVRLGPT